MSERFFNERSPYSGEYYDRESLPWCEDNCAHFRFLDSEAIFEGIDKGFIKRFKESYNPCELGHHMAFRVPRTMGEVSGINWGHYKKTCRDRTATSHQSQRGEG